MPEAVSVEVVHSVVPPEVFTVTVPVGLPSLVTPVTVPVKVWPSEPKVLGEEMVARLIELVLAAS